MDEENKSLSNRTIAVLIAVPVILILIVLFIIIIHRTTITKGESVKNSSPASVSVSDTSETTVSGTDEKEEESSETTEETTMGTTEDAAAVTEESTDSDGEAVTKATALNGTSGTITTVTESHCNTNPYSQSYTPAETEKTYEPSTAASTMTAEATTKNHTNTRKTD